MSSEEAAETSEELTFDEVQFNSIQFNSLFALFILHLESARFEKLLPTAWFEGFW